MLDARTQIISDELAIFYSQKFWPNHKLEGRPAKNETIFGEIDWFWRPPWIVFGWQRSMKWHQRHFSDSVSRFTMIYAMNSALKTKKKCQYIIICIWGVSRLPERLKWTFFEFFFLHLASRITLKKFQKPIDFSLWLPQCCTFLLFWSTITMS